MDRPTIRPSIIGRAAAAIQTWLAKQRCCLGTVRKTKGKTKIESLPDELLFDILVRLPADFLHGRARLVCRKWRHIIRSDAFVSTHFQHYSSYGLVVLLPYSDPLMQYVTASHGQIEKSKVTDICSNKIWGASCNGLVVGTLDSRSLHVLNPAKKQSFLLPSISTDNGYFYFHEAGIAFSLASMEYKVTLPYKTTHEDGHAQYYLYIVTVGVDKSWRHVEIPPLLECFRSLFHLVPPQSSEGFVHWGQCGYCLTLNVETEILTMTESPILTMSETPSPGDQWCDDHGYSYYYLSTGRYITLLANRVRELSWEVWEMRPAESGEWRKAVLPNIDLEPQKCKLQQRFCDDDYIDNLEPVGWVKYPEVLALCYGRLVRTCILYNLETHEIDKIDKLPNYRRHHDYTVLVHRNSLVWFSQN